MAKSSSKSTASSGTRSRPLTRGPPPRTRNDGCCGKGVCFGPCCKKMVCWTAFLALIGVGTYLGVYYFGDRNRIPEPYQLDLPDLPEGLENLPKDLWDRLPEITIFDAEDPFNQVNPDDANRWRTNDNNGLELELVNALDPQWFEYFTVAVQEWDVPVDGTSPDTLTLRTSNSAADSECAAIRGLQKVCNGDYGETDWKGINKVLLENGWIVASMARMNDHFFTDGGDVAKRQYTMCHELGHGFGLPHTDESFWNRPLGNCLDYTTSYNTNKSPDDTNYIYLRDLYGAIGDGTGRKLRKRETQRELFHLVKDSQLRQSLQEQLDGLDAMFDQGQIHSHPSWRLLHTSEAGEAHRVQLDENYSVEIHTLRP